MKKILILVFALAIFLLPARNTVFSADYEGKIIKKVTFTGLKKAEEKKIKSTLFLTEGIKFETENASKDFKNLYSLGYFEDIQLDIKEEDGKLVLSYIVVERPWITKIKIKGNDELSESTVLKLLSNKEEGFYDPYVLQLDREKIIKELIKEGYVDSEVAFSIEKAEKAEKDNEVELIVEIKEGEEIYIEEIKLFGTKNLDADEVKKAMEKTREPWILGLKHFAYDEAEYKTAEQQKMLQYAKDRGYINFKIKDTKVEKRIIDEKKQKQAYFMTIEVEEGDQYYFGGVQIHGNQKIDSKDLMSALDLQKGDVYNDSKFIDFMRNAYMSYQNEGFFYAKITPKEEKDEKSKVISYTVDFYEGEKVHIENMYIIGNTKTETYVVDREIRIKEGEIYDLSKLLKSRERLMKTQYFSNAMFEPKTGSEEGLVDLYWKVDEAKTGLLTVGGGWGTLSGWTLFAQVSELNFMGKGINMSIRGDYGQKRQAISTSIGQRYLFNTYIPISWSLSASYSWQRVDMYPKYDRNGNGIWDKVYDNGSGYQVYDEGSPGFDTHYEKDYNGDGTGPDSTSSDYYYKRQSFGLGLGLGYAISDYWHIGGSQGITWSMYYHPVGINVSKIYESSDYRLKTLFAKGERDEYEPSTRTGVSLTYDSTDNYLTPTKGIVFNPASYYFGLLGGYNRFTELDCDLSGYVNLSKLLGLYNVKAIKRNNWDMVLAAHVGVSTITKLPGDDHPQIYAENRLYFDGMRELRGWGDYVYSDEFYGNGKVSAGLEWRIPIPGTERLLWWAFFFDAGDVSQDYFSLPGDFSRYKYSEGFGLKIEIPMFPIRFYFAKRLEWKDGWFREQRDPSTGRLSGWNFVLSISGFF